MGGGVLQLVAVGAQDLYLTGNPSFTYFSTVFKRHTNFSMESIRLEFYTKPTLSTNGGLYSVNIDRNADLLRECFFSFTLPDIYSDNTLQFRWVKNIACVMIDQYYITIGGSGTSQSQRIDIQYGLWNEIWVELSMSGGKRKTFNNISGSKASNNTPTAAQSEIIIKNNAFTYSTYPGYPEYTGGGPSIPGDTYFLPLNFWFCKNPALALPLICLQKQPVQFWFSLRPVSELYQVYDNIGGRYLSPTYYNSLTGLSTDVSIGKFLVPTGTPAPADSTIDLQAYIEANYVYLDTPERNTVASSQQDFLFETVQVQNNLDNVSVNATLSLTLHNPTKELVWVTQRSDAYIYNEWSNYSYTIPESKKSILSTAQLLFNGFTRLEEKPYKYFNVLQPYQYHSNMPRQGIYVYSFALFPEKSNPSGTANFSMYNNISIKVELNAPASSTDVLGNQLLYNVVVYSVTYNILRFSAGCAATVFSS